MKEKVLCYLLILVSVLVFNVFLLAQIRQEAHSLLHLDEAAFLPVVRNQQIPDGLYETFHSYEEEGDYDRYAYLTGYLYSNLTDKAALDHLLERFMKRYPAEYQKYYQYEKAVWSQLELFPVAESLTTPGATVAFEDSWMQSRTFGGNRGHEGCDIMSAIKTRGYYPIVSVSDGVIEQIGWLTQGGYRIGVRSSNGAYFYYAHLYDYAKDFARGDTVAAGELLGFMGDSGYSEIEGTVGNFDVHLHFGIYLNDEENREFSINSYAPLRYLKQRKKKCVF